MQIAIRRVIGRRVAAAAAAGAMALGLVLTNAAPAQAATHDFVCGVSPTVHVVCGAGSGLTVTSLGEIWLYVFEKRYGNSLGVIAIYCNGNDLGGWVQVETVAFTSWPMPLRAPASN